METDAKSAQMKITYATMTADRMEDLHRELDRAIDRVKTDFGKSYPLVIGGREVRSSSQFDDRSPIDTRIVLGRFQSATRLASRAEKSPGCHSCASEIQARSPSVI